MTNRVVLLAAVIVFALPAAAVAQKEARKGEKEGSKKGVVQKTVSDLTWHDMPGTPVQASDVWTGPGGSHCNFTRFPKGTTVPPHFHTSDIHAVVIAGQWGSAAEGAPESLVGPGTYQLIPGKLKHTTKCAEAEDCIIYTCSPAKFDIKGLPSSKPAGK
jgi:quercetin dioxygenase-like cupin family protein